MSLKFNPLTGQLDFAAAQGVGPASTSKTDQIIVDANFLTTPEKTLELAPILDSEYIFLNGLFTCNTEYTITGNTFSWTDSSDLRVGDIIDIKYQS